MFNNPHPWIRNRARRDGKSRSLPLHFCFRSTIHAMSYTPPSDEHCNNLYAFLVNKYPGVSELFSSAPCSLKVLCYANQREEPWKPVLPALTVISTETDTFSINLQNLSTVLQELRLDNTSLSPDFLWPLDESGRPLPSDGTLEWPNLRILELNDFPPFLPSGKWLALPTPEEQARIDQPNDEISAPEDLIGDNDRGWACREMVDHEEFHRLFTSIGHAARHMPHLKSITFNLDHNPTLEFSFRTDSDPITAQWHSMAQPEYDPDRRVAEAWGFRIEDYNFDTGVNFPCWPPEEMTRRQFDKAYKDEDQRGMSLTHFQKLTSGAGAIRRAWIRNLQYDILVPFELLDWTTRKRETGQYSIANPVREANNRAFQTAIINLFGILGQWDRNNRLSLDLGLRGRRVGENPAPEPNTSYFDIAGDYRHDFKTGRTDAVPPYRARFYNNYASVLAHRYHQIWAGTVAQIVQHCPTVTELYLNLDEWVRPDHLEYIKARRDAVSEIFSNTPHSLKVLHYANQPEKPWKDSMPALNVLSTGTDTLTVNLRRLSTFLRELKLEHTSLCPDFLWPLDETGHPLPSTVHWPNLTVLELNNAPPRLPSGQWLALPTAEWQEEIDEIEDWEEEICDYESGCVDRSINDDEQFHRFFISLGYAARHMPRLRYIQFSLDHGPTTTFSFRRDLDPITAEWLSEADPEYRPDERVAKAWGFRLEDIEIMGAWDMESVVRFAYWPPEEV
ncbi:hypothetical protein ANOM_010509 [Aspergillus nomiae NRRL 13137]|uniref:Uncharacterized protein n=1 Tax=Aspergillus nomiae NRRL (strain ATCC 15546 / NRRL 13137 / CBS 260.88 / M93) TaxID=1509407 RepID=A0A0L1IPX4_ASPN3|nr:uncharacterized protein ANOM_010509 [Aspergillus nomiae NRRL 13137]KNG81400.1 hypothetical protein ANOM_010509 [Aspergillus nomiae NRRL 13137]